CVYPAAALIFAASFPFCMPPSPAYSLVRTTIPYAMGGIAFAINGILALADAARDQSRKVLRRSRVLLIGVLCLFAGLAYLVQLVASAFGIVYVPYVKLLFLAVFAFWLGVDLVVFHRRYLEEKAARLDAEQENAKHAMIARTTQMLAHDVRRPFS